MNTAPFIIDSGKPGPALLVLGGIHGDERCGVDLVRRMMEQPGDFMPSIGKIICAFGNPVAIEADTRFVTHNLNRLFVQEEERSSCQCAEHVRAPAIRAMLRSADVLLDIHASFTQKSEPFVICERNGVGLLRDVPVKRVCFGFDAIQSGGTDCFMNAIGKVGICIECGYLGDSSCGAIAEQSLEGVMMGMGMKGQTERRQTSHTFLQAYRQYVTRENFETERSYADFDEVQAGDLLGWDGVETILAEERSCILFARDRDAPMEEAFVLLRSVSI